MSETNLKKTALKYLNSLDRSFFIKIHGGLFQMVGVSDLIGVYHGRFVAVELKVGKNQPSKVQLRFLDKVRKCGGIAACCWSMDDIIQALP